jgi:hypothetical protein
MEYEVHMHLIRISRAVALLALVSSMLCSSAFCQEGLSTLRGTATDTTGAVVPGFAVVAREVATNVVARTVSTDAQGNFEMPGLSELPGTGI